MTQTPSAGNEMPAGTTLGVSGVGAHLSAGMVGKWGACGRFSVMPSCTPWGLRCLQAAQGGSVLPRNADSDGFVKLTHYSQRV